MAVTWVIILVLLLAWSATAQANVVLPAIFGDHMVLQQGMDLPIWGTAEPGERVVVELAGQTASAIADANGRWSVKLKALETQRQPIEVRVRGVNEILLKDVLVGDVWLCSGQSNMDWPVQRSLGGAEAIAKANHSGIRLFVVEKRLAFTPQETCRGEWKVCTPASVPDFSAVGYFFGREVHRHLQRPVGLVAACWGGTRGEGWVSLAGLSDRPALSDLVETFRHRRDNLVSLRSEYLDQTLPQWERDHAHWRAMRQSGRTPLPPEPAHPYLQDPITPHQAVVLHHGMIAPLGRLALQGVIWYQGESNDHRPRQYREVFAALIHDWRRQFRQDDLPFLYVQLASHRERQASPSHHAWCTIREAQAQLAQTPKVGMVSAIDVGEIYNIHPSNKRVVAERLFRAARSVAYGEKVEWSGPTCRDWVFEPAGRVRIRFDRVGGGLIVAEPATQPSESSPRPGTELRGFSIAGDDRVFNWATARIEGDEVVVWSDRVPSPCAVRYGWASNPDVTLYSRELLPAVPFRTDTWPTPDR